MNVLGKWNRLSIRRKSIIWLSTLVAVLLAMMGIASMAQRYMMAQPSRLQEDDSRCYAVQEALERERQTLENLILEAARIIRQSGKPCVILYLTASTGWDRSGRILSPTSGNTTPKSFPCRMWPGP